MIQIGYPDTLESGNEISERWWIIDEEGRGEDTSGPEGNHQGHRVVLWCFHIHRTQIYLVWLVLSRIQSHCCLISFLSTQNIICELYRILYSSLPCLCHKTQRNDDYLSPQCKVVFRKCTNIIASLGPGWFYKIWVSTMSYYGQDIFYINFPTFYFSRRLFSFPELRSFLSLRKRQLWFVGRRWVY